MTTRVDTRNLVGRECSSLERVRFAFADEPIEDVGPIIIGWSDGTFLTIDVGADWTLRLKQADWQDPYESLSDGERARIRHENGVFVREAVAASDPINLVVGSELTALRRIGDEVDQIIGVGLSFGSLGIRAEAYGGELVVTATTTATESVPLDPDGRRG
ncbi:hypothetical protein [Agromyces sp. Marseille-Q5079]|uniref:hypothetical protein n=1 Tax=Agromyces sp. Marseille-Q5079 TaxID=3439059 RepID=UPI003D9C8599